MEELKKKANIINYSTVLQNRNTLLYFIVRFKYALFCKMYPGQGYRAKRI